MHLFKPSAMRFVINIKEYLWITLSAFQPALAIKACEKQGYQTIVWLINIKRNNFVILDENSDTFPVDQFACDILHITRFYPIRRIKVIFNNTKVEFPLGSIHIDLHKIRPLCLISIRVYIQLCDISSKHLK